MDLENIKSSIVNNIYPFLLTTYSNSPGLFTGDIISKGIFTGWRGCI